MPGAAVAIGTGLIPFLPADIVKVFLAATRAASRMEVPALSASARKPARYFTYTQAAEPIDHLPDRAVGRCRAAGATNGRP